MRQGGWKAWGLVKQGGRRDLGEDKQGEDDRGQ